MIIFKNLLRFNIFIFFLLPMIPAPASYGEIISEKNYSFEPLDYIVEGETVGCGIKFSAINKEILFLDASVNLNYSKKAKSFYSIFKVTAKEMGSLDGQFAPSDVYVNHGWIKTSQGTTFEYLTLDRGEDRNDFLALNASIKNVMKIFAEINLGNIKLGFNKEAGKFDKVFELQSSPSPSTRDKINSCLNDLMKTLLKYNPKKK